MRILISNDDGIQSRGIHHLVDCVRDMGEIYVVAPDSARSGQSSAMTVNAPLRIHEHDSYNGARMFSTNGTPVDCVKLAMHTILPSLPDLMLSGINHGSNAGNSIIYSGTMGAVFEASMQGVPSIGYSLLSHAADADFGETSRLIRDITARIIEHGLPEDVCLNVNFPARCVIEGLKVCRAARSHWTEEYQRYDDPHGQPFYWLTGRLVNEEPESTDTDLYWLDHHYATVVPASPELSVQSAIKPLADVLGAD